jgi:hypothetical protein
MLLISRPSLPLMLGIKIPMQNIFPFHPSRLPTSPPCQTSNTLLRASSSSDSTAVVFLLHPAPRVHFCCVDAPNPFFAKNLCSFSLCFFPPRILSMKAHTQGYIVYVCVIVRETICLCSRAYVNVRLSTCRGERVCVGVRVLSQKSAQSPRID